MDSKLTALLVEAVVEVTQFHVILVTRGFLSPLRLTKPTLMQSDKLCSVILLKYLRLTVMGVKAC